MKRYFKVMCDECGTVYPHVFAESSEEAHQRMAEDDWVQTEDKRDLCPKCALKAVGVE